jgi:sugar lactone lactonase YvrE
MTVQFANPDGGRVDVLPWRFDPAGRLVLVSEDPGPNGSQPSTGSGPPLPANQRIGLLDVASGRLVAQARLGNVVFPTALAWSHDRRLLAVTTLTGTLALYDADTLALRINVGSVSSGWVNTLAFAPDDRTLVTGDTAGSVNLLSVPDLVREGQHILIGNSANNGGNWAWFAPDGNIVGFAQDSQRPSGGMRWFEFDARPSALAAAACTLAGADITRAQWQRYVGDRPYRHVCAT